MGMKLGGVGGENMQVILQYLIHFGITAKKTKKEYRMNCRKARFRMRDKVKC